VRGDGKRLTAFHELLELVGNLTPKLQNPFNPLAVLGTAFDIFPQRGGCMIWNSDQVAMLSMLEFPHVTMR
jgi:hypothetical protein